MDSMNREATVKVRRNGVTIQHTLRVGRHI
jgi:hypothetical protein